MGSAHPGHDHDHHLDPEEDDLPLEDNPIWQQDNVTLRTVGMDIGSSGTQVLFSALHLRRISEDLSSRYVVVRRETLYRSPVALTPYADAEHIDAEALGCIIDDAYAAAHTLPCEVDTGVVILTGSALRRRNAQAITTVLAARAGELVTAAAGHNMEALLAAHGSGAVEMSYRLGLKLLNIDIGGGTTKFALVDHGQVTATAAYDIGGRLLVLDDQGAVTRLEPAGKLHAARVGLNWQLGGTVTADAVDSVAASMADAVITSILTPDASAAAELCLTEPLPAIEDLDGVMFSGGVAEYVYGREQNSFGDLGRPLGRALRSRVDDRQLPFPLLPAGECIRATALGASEYSVQLSGNTGLITEPGRLLPRRNLQVVRAPYFTADRIDARALATAIQKRVADVEADDRDLVLALTWAGLPTYQRLMAFAQGVRDGLADRIAQGHAIYLVLDGDVAMSVGRLMRAELHVSVDLLVVDGLVVGEFDYLDIGAVRHPSGTVPVTIKSLVFSHDATARTGPADAAIGQVER